MSDGTNSAFAAILFSRLFSISASVIQLPALAYLVDRHTFSTVSTVIATSVFVSLVGFEGTILAFQRFPRSSSDLASYSYSHRRLMWLTFAVTISAAAPMLVTHHAIYAMAFVGWGCGLAWMRFVSAAWLMWRHPWRYALNLAASTATRTGVLLGSLAFGVHASVALALAGFASVVIAFLFGPKPNYEASASRNRPWPKGLAISLALASAGVTLLTGVDRMLATAILGGTAAASYLAMAGVGSLSLGSVLSLINVASYPQLIDCWQAGRESGVARCLGHAITWTIVAMAAILALMVTAGDPILRLILPGSYVETRLLLGVSVATGLVALGQVYSWSFHLATAGKALRDRTAVATLLMLILVIAGGRIIGPRGLCLGLVFGSAIYCLMIEAFPIAHPRRVIPIIALTSLGTASLLDGSEFVILVGCLSLIWIGYFAGRGTIDSALLESMADETELRKDGLQLNG